MSSPSQQAKSADQRDANRAAYTGPERRQGDRRKGLGTPDAGRLDTRLSPQDRRRS